MEEQPGVALFANVVFVVIPSDTLEEQPLIGALTNNGAQHLPLRSSDNQIEDLQRVTTIISSHIDFPQYSTALDNNINVVKPSWVAQSIKRLRMVSPRQHSPDPSQFFQDVVLTSANLPDGDRDAIVAGILVLGGQYSSPLTKLVTHIVTMDVENEKIRIAKEKDLNVKIVLPHWFDHCFRLGKKINERPYMFPDPPYLETGSPTGAMRSAPTDHVDGATGARPHGDLPKSPPYSPPSSPSAARKNLVAFKGKKVMLSKDLELGDHLLQTLEGLVVQGGGSVTRDVDEADIYVCHYRSGRDYVTASRARKEVANLSWLYHVINRNKYTNPLTKLLHYPVPKGGLPGFENMTISVSNYTGDARIYLENLIGECGAKFTKTMKQDNTHLITAHDKSEKVDAAKEWNIHIINHLWLEDSYARCAVQTLSNVRYNTFPLKTNLSEVVGQTNLDMNKVEQRFFPKSQSPQKPAPVNAPQPTSRPSPRKTVPASSVMTIGSPLATRQSIPAHLNEDTAMEDEDEEEGEEDEAEAEPQATKKARGRPRKSAIATPRARDDEKENQTPANLSTARASKMKAANVIQKQSVDIALFQKEMKRKGGVVHGGRRSSHLEDSTSPAPEVKKGKRKSDEGTYDVTAEGSALSDGETQEKPARATKKAKLAQPKVVPAKLPPVEHRMMVTGEERWVKNVKQEDEDRTKLRQLGVLLTQDPVKVDILVAPKILRTRKFVGALASAPMVVDSKYLDAALKHGKLVENPSTLRDQVNEERCGFKLSESLARAKINNHKLLRGWSIFVTEGIQGGFDTFQEIIKLNGGDAFKYAGRTGIKIPKPRSRNDPEAGEESQHQGDDKEFDVIYLVSGESEAEIKHWKTFRELAKKQGLEARIVKSDWLLLVAMAQEIRWDPKWELEEA